MKTYRVMFHYACWPESEWSFWTGTRCLREAHQIVRQDQARYPTYKFRIETP